VSQSEHTTLRRLPDEKRAGPQDIDGKLTVEDIEIEVAREPFEEIRVVPNPSCRRCVSALSAPPLTRQSPHVFERISTEVSEVILVHGNSTDGTVQVAKQLRPNLTVFRQIGQGKGNATTSGFWAATGDIIVMLDGTVHRPSEIPASLPLSWAALTSPKSATSSPVAAVPTVLRSAASATGHSLRLSKALGGQFSDLCYGYNAFWRRCLPFVTPDCESSRSKPREHTGGTSPP